MANSSLAQSINRQHVGQALRLMRHECRYEAAELNAINRAALNLEACPWAFDGETLRIASATTRSTRYTVSPEGCECKAAQDGRPCWHRAAWRLLRKAAELVQPVRVMPTEAELQALVDELFA